MGQPQGVPEQSQDSGSPCPNQSCCPHVEVRSVLTLTHVAWVCAAAAAEQRLPEIQLERWYSSHLAALEIPFSLFRLPWTDWLILGTSGDGVSRAGGPLVRWASLHFPGSGL